MPTVPVTQGRQVRQALPSGGFNNTRISANAVGGGVARAVQGLGQDLNQVAGEIEKAAVQIKREDDTLAVMEAENALLNWEQQNLYNPEGGYFNSEGKNALGGVGRIGAEYDKQAGEVFGSLQNDDQRMAFQKITQQRRRSIQSSVAQHESRQRKVVLNDNAAALQSQSIDSAAASYNDREAVAFHMQTGIRAITAHSMSQGESALVRDQRIKEFTGDAHTAVVERMMDDDPIGAMEYFDANKDQMNAATAEAVGNRLENVVNQDKSRFESESIYNSGGSLASQLAKARKIKDTDVSDETVRRLKILHSEQKAAQTEALGNAWDKLYENPDLDAIPNWVRGEDRAKMKNYITGLRTGAAKDTDYGYYSELANMTPQELAQQNIDPTRLKESHLKQFIDDQAKARGGKGETNFYTSNNVATVAKEFMVQAGVKDKGKVGLFTARLREEVEQEQQATGNKLTYSDLQKVADRLTLVGQEDTFAFGFGQDEKKVFELEIPGVDNKFVDEAATVIKNNGKQPLEEDIKGLVNSVLADQDNIAEMLRARGYPVTMSNMMNFKYLEDKNK